MIVLYVLETCPYCNGALKLLQDNKIKYKSIIVENTEEAKNYYKKQNNMSTFPQIFMQINKDNYMKLGGYDNLNETIGMCKSIKNSNVSLDSIYHLYQKLYKK
jgi:glutaredoxin